MYSPVFLAVLGGLALAAPGLNKSAPGSDPEHKPGRIQPLQLQLTGMKVCRGWGDPHYTSFDNGDLDSLSHGTLPRMHGTYLMVGTCGNPNGSPLTVWLTTVDNGYTQKVEVSTIKDRQHLTFVMSNKDFSECYIGFKYDMPGEYDECRQDALDLGVELVWNNGALTVVSNDASGQPEWKVVAYMDGNLFSSAEVHLREAIYKNKVRGTCGDMNSSPYNDAYCWNPSVPVHLCWEQITLKPQKWWRHGNCPATCPPLQPSRFFMPAEVAAEPVDPAKEAAALKLCRPIVDKDGPFKDCLTTEEGERYAKGCVADETVRSGGGCVVVRDLARRCERGGLQIDLGRTKCLTRHS